MIKNFKKGYLVFTAGDPRHEFDSDIVWFEHSSYVATKRDLEKFFNSYEDNTPFYNWLLDDLDLETYTEKDFNMSMKALSVVEMTGEYDFEIAIYDLAKDIFIPVSPFWKKDLKTAVEYVVEEYKGDNAPRLEGLSKCEKIKQLTEELHRLTSS